MIYLDNNATTPVAPEVAEAMRTFSAGPGGFGNPGSAHRAGRAARAAVDAARDRVAALIGCRADEVVFTGGATESNNAALRGAVAAEGRPVRLLVAADSHPSVLAPAARLARDGVALTHLPVRPDGLLDLDRLAGLLAESRGGATVVSVLWANNETGVLQPVREIAGLVRATPGAVLHLDATQAVGKVPVSFAEVPADLLSLTAHKFHGPKGVGALIVRKGTHWEPLLLGGAQERDRRGGTENVPGIVGFGEACRLAGEWLASGGPARKAALRDRLESAVRSAVPDAAVTAGGSPRNAATSNIRFPGCRGEVLLMALDEAGVCVSTGSACSSGSQRPSHVLTAMGLPEAEARSALRFSLSRYTTAEEIDAAARAVAEAAGRARRAAAMANEEW
jgi:cysteine desulfurase